MVEALQYMHEAGYVHADVKSANILLKNSGKEVKLNPGISLLIYWCRQGLLWSFLSFFDLID